MSTGVSISYSNTFSPADIPANGTDTISSVNLNGAALLVLQVYSFEQGYGTPPFSSITYAGIPLTHLTNTDITLDSAGYNAWTYYLVAPASSPNSIIITAPSGIGFSYQRILMSVIGLSGVSTAVSPPIGILQCAKGATSMTLAGVTAGSAIAVFEVTAYNIGTGTPSISSTSGTWLTTSSIAGSNYNALRTFFVDSVAASNTFNYTGLSSEAFISLVGIEILSSPISYTITASPLIVPVQIGRTTVGLTPHYIVASPLVVQTQIGSTTVVKQPVHATAARLLIINITSVTPNANWPSDGSAYAGNAFAWSVTFSVTAQPHSDPRTQTPYQYNGLDVRTGDWLSNLASLSGGISGGIAYQIDTIVMQTASTVTCIVEDVDQYNTYISNVASNIIPRIAPVASIGLLFTASTTTTSSVPVMIPTPPNILQKTWQTDIISRFKYDVSLPSIVSINNALINPAPLFNYKVLSTLGNQIIDSDGNPVRLRSCTWYGFESLDYMVHGLYETSYQSVLDTASALGFNCIRLPFASTVVIPDFSVHIAGTYSYPITTDSSGMVNPNRNILPYNASLSGLNSIQAMDVIIQYAASVGLYIILDNHRITSFPRFASNAQILSNSTGEYGTDGWPLGPTYDNYAVTGGDNGTTFSVNNWQTMWNTLATRYKHQSNVVGFDLHNEPCGPVSVSSGFPGPTGSVPNAWQTWENYMHDYFIPCANSIRSLNSNVLIIAEGMPSDQYGTAWWGGGLGNVNTANSTNYTVPLHNISTLAGKIVYSPHDYGQTVSAQDWLYADQITSKVVYPLYDTVTVPNAATYSGQYNSANGTDGTWMVKGTNAGGIGLSRIPHNYRPANYPQNIVNYWYPHWGYLFYNNIAPIWIGEFGGALGLDDNNNIQTVTYNGITYPAQINAAYEIQWLTALESYMNGYSAADTTITVDPVTYAVTVTGGTNVLTGNQLGMSFAYFSLDPEGAPLIGLVDIRDYKSIQSKLINLLVPILKS